MRVASLLVFLGFALLSSASAVAQSTPPLNPSTPQMSPEATARTQALLQAMARARALLPARPTVTYRCGLVMVPVDPAFDARIRRPVPAGKFTIKRMKPPVCAQ
jgi:hypothetical protein